MQVKLQAAEKTAYGEQEYDTINFNGAPSYIDPLCPGQPLAVDTGEGDVVAGSRLC